MFFLVSHYGNDSETKENKNQTGFKTKKNSNHNIDTSPWATDLSVARRLVVAIHYLGNKIFEKEGNLAVK